MTKARKKVADLLKVRSGEGPAVALMWIHSFFVGMTIVFLETPASSLFLTHFDVDTLPYFFMATAVASVAIGFLVTWLQPRFAPRVFFPGLVAVLFAVTLGFYMALAAGMPRPLVLAFMIWKDVTWTLLVFEFWAVAGLLLHVRQGKRLFGLLNSGKILAALAGGLATPLFVSHLGTLQLVILGLVGLLGSFVSSSAILRSPSLSEVSGRAEVESGAGKEVPLAPLFHDRFLVLFFTVTVLSNLAFYFLEYLFYDQVERTWPDADQIASFFGLYIGVGQGLNLVVSALVTGRLLTRFGLTAGLLSVPVLVASGLVAAVATRFFPGAAVAFFWCVTGTKLLQEVVGSALSVPASRILYQPLRKRERLRVQSALESIIEPATAGFAGLLLLALPALFALEAAGLLYPVLGLVVVWGAFALALRTEYTGALTRALKGRRFRDVDLSLSDASSLLVLERELENPRPGGTIYCLTILEELEHPALDRFLVRLLDHPSEIVRTFVLERIEHRLVKGAEDPVARRIEIETDPSALGAALRAYCALASDGGLEKTLGYLEAERPELRRGALIGLLRSGGIEGVLTAGTQLIHLVESEDAKERRFAAHALGEVGIKSFYRPLIQLLDDPDMRVRREALKAAGKLRSPGLVASLIANLGVPAVADAAVSSLIAYGDAALGPLEEEFHRGEATISVAARIVRIAGHVGSARARDFLRGWIDHPQEDLRYDVLRALTKCGYRAPAEDLGKIRQLVFFEAEDAAWTLATLIDLGEARSETDISAALYREIRKNTRRILMLLSFMYPPETVLKAKAELESGAAENRARAVELLDEFLDAELKAAVLPLVDDLSPRARLAELGKRFPQESLGRRRRLHQLITRTSDKSTAWAKACAIYAAGRSRLAELEESVSAATEDPDPFIRETAIWSLAQLAPGRLGRHLARLVHDPSENVSRMARWILEAQSPVKIYGGRGYLAHQGGFRVDFVERLLADGSQPLASRVRAARILGSLRDPQARRVLLKRLHSPEAPLRSAILEALDSAPTPRGARERRAFTRALEEELETAVRISDRLGVFPRGELFQRLRGALETELESMRERLLRLLVLLSGDLDSTTLRFWYLRPHEGGIPESVSDALGAALDSVADEEVRREAREILESGELTRDGEESERPPLVDVLVEIAQGPLYRSWTRACAVEMLARAGLPECVPAVVEALGDPDETVREVAWWALSKLSPPTFQREARLRGEDENPRVARLVADLREASAKN